MSIEENSSKTHFQLIIDRDRKDMVAGFERLLDWIEENKGTLKEDYLEVSMLMGSLIDDGQKLKIILFNRERPN